MEFKRKRSERGGANIAARSCRCNLVGLAVRETPRRRGLVDVTRRVHPKRKKKNTAEEEGLVDTRRSSRYRPTAD